MAETIKVILLGDSGVGKTSFLLRFTDNIFQQSYGTTIGVDFKTKEMTVGDRKVVLNIWDTAGQERFKSIGHAYYREADGIIILYDSTSMASFRSAKQWYKEAIDFTRRNISVLLVGNKSDLQDKQVFPAEAQQYADSLRAQFIESSALQGHNVFESFRILAEEISSNRSDVRPSDKKSIRAKAFTGSQMSAFRDKKKCC